MNAKELAKEFTDLCAKGEFAVAGERFWSDEVVSLEAMGEMPVATSKAAVKQKSAWFAANNQIHDLTIEGPFVHGNQFLVRFDIHLTPKGGSRTRMLEAGLFTVQDGKITEERFFPID